MNRSTRAAVGLATMLLLAPLAALLLSLSPDAPSAHGCMDAVALGPDLSSLDFTPYFVAGLVALVGLALVLSAFIGAPSGPRPPRTPWRPSTLRLAIGGGLVAVVAPVEAFLVPSTHLPAILAAVAGLAFIASSLRRRPAVPTAIVVAAP